MKLPEAAAFKLFDQYSLPHPDFFIAPPTEEKFFQKYSQFVVKANVPVGGKKKSGLVQIVNRDRLNDAIREICGQEIPGYQINSVTVEEFVPHREEFFVALKAVREGLEIYYSGTGGIDVEKNWERVEKVLIPSERIAKTVFLQEDFFFDIVAEKFVRDWIIKLIQFFQDGDATYLEINPFTIVGKQVMPLGVVLEVDEAAEFRHAEWSTVYSLQSTATPREKRVAEVDSQIRGSIKLVEVPISYQLQAKSSKLTAMIGGGAGAALFLCDAIVNAGFELANYAEFSGNPPNFAVTELVKEVCRIPGIKNLVIGSGIANFTPVVGNMEAIIAGLRASPQAKGLKIVVRRCGPGEQEAIEIMKKFVKDSGWKNIQVFGRETGMTEIVKSLK